MPEWGRFGYGVELDEKTVREIGMKLCKNENALYETSELEWRHHPFSLAPVSSLNGNLVMLIGRLNLQRIVRYMSSIYPNCFKNIPTAKI